MTKNISEDDFRREIGNIVNAQDLLKMTIRDRMSIMAKLGRELIRKDITNFFVGAVMTGSDVVFPATVIFGDNHKAEIQKGLIELANNIKALCVTIVMEASAVKGTAENFQPHLRISEHPNRREGLVVDAKDYFEHLAGMQFIRRSEDNIEFEELQIGSSPRSWLDEWQVNSPTTITC